MNSNKLINRFIKKYNFLLDDYNEVKNIYNNAFYQINKEVNKQLGDDLFFQLFTQVDNNNDNDKKINKEEKDPFFKKLYHKLVFQLHPDKLNNNINYYRNLYDQTIYAYKNNDWALLLSIASELQIDLNFIPNSYLKEIETNIDDLEANIKNITNSIPFKWYFTENYEDQLNLLNNYIKNISGKNFKINHTNKKPIKLLKMQEKEVLGLGHPRSGTHFTSLLLQSFNLDIKHERLGKNGIVDWTMVSGSSFWQPLNINDFSWKIILYCIRNPKNMIPSLVYTEDIYNIANIRDKALDFRKNTLNINKEYNPIEFAIYSIIKWEEKFKNLFKNKSNVYFFKIDEKENYYDLFNLLKENNINVEWSKETEKTINIQSNKRNHPSFEKMIEDMGKPKNWYCYKINRFAERYGYNRLF